MQGKTAENFIIGYPLSGKPNSLIIKNHIYNFLLAGKNVKYSLLKV